MFGPRVPEDVTAPLLVSQGSERRGLCGHSSQGLVWSGARGRACRAGARAGGGVGCVLAWASPAAASAPFRAEATPVRALPSAQPSRPTGGGSRVPGRLWGPLRSVCLPITPPGLPLRGAARSAILPPLGSPGSSPSSSSISHPAHALICGRVGAEKGPLNPAGAGRPSLKAAGGLAGRQHPHPPPTRTAAGAGGSECRPCCPAAFEPTTQQLQAFGGGRKLRGGGTALLSALPRTCVITSPPPS